MGCVVDDAYRARLWPLPPLTQTAEGEARRVGVELEFAGLDLPAIVDLLQHGLGGEVKVVSDYEQLLHGTRLGDFTIELDFAWLKRVGRERQESASREPFGESLLKLAAEQVVPWEVVGPPVPMVELWRLCEPLAKLREAGALGTGHAPHYAFGLHLNPELPALDAPTILAYLRAFLCLFDWLRQRSRISLTRRLTPYIDPFPGEYCRQIQRADYAPDMSTLIDDYLRFNPTRNRALDLLPLFAHLDEERVRSRVPDPRIKARPTLHYRLPNCQIDEPEWGLVLPWRDWLQVEALACDEARLRRAVRGWHAANGGATGGLFSNWEEQCRRYLLPELL